MSMHNQKLKTDKQIKIRKFARELEADLPDLIEEYPNGIYLSHLTEYYGESVNRVSHAIKILQIKDKVQICRALSEAVFILPKDYTPPIPFPELSDLQRKLLTWVQQTLKDKSATTLLTNYGQISRILECSYGGLRSCLQRLTKSGYLEISAPSLRGKQDSMAIKLGVRVLQPQLCQLSLQEIEE